MSNQFHFNCAIKFLTFVGGMSIQKSRFLTSFKSLFVSRKHSWTYSLWKNTHIMDLLFKDCSFMKCLYLSFPHTLCVKHTIHSLSHIISISIYIHRYIHAYLRETNHTFSPHLSPQGSPKSTTMQYLDFFFSFGSQQ